MIVDPVGKRERAPAGIRVGEKPGRERLAPEREGRACGRPGRILIVFGQRQGERPRRVGEELGLSRQQIADVGRGVAGQLPEQPVDDVPQRELGGVSDECGSDAVVLVVKQFGGWAAPLKVGGEGQIAEAFGCRGAEQDFFGAREPVCIDVAEPGDSGGDDGPGKFAGRAGQQQKVVD